MEQQNDYTAVPPPANLTGSSSEAAAAPVNFNDALSKARAIAEKLKQQQQQQAANGATAGSKRGYQEASYHDDRGGYPSSRGYESHDHYDDRESKRGMYESSGYGDSRRYGLGTDERRNTYGGALNAQPVIREEMTVPSNMVGMIIGKGGENLRRTERMSGAKVQFAEDTGAPERIVEITGEADQVKIARDMIQQTVDDGRANEAVRYGGRSSGNDAYAAYGGSSRTSSTITVPSFRVGLIIGRGGETIRDLEERSGAKININPEPIGTRSEERTIGLSGDDAAVNRAKDLINDLLHGGGPGSGRDYRQQQHGRDDHRGGYGGREGHDSYGSYGPQGGGGYRGRPGEERESVVVPKSVVGFIIGKGGETVRMLQEQSGARIKVDQNAHRDDPDRVINIFGNPDAVAYAKQLILDKVEEGNANYGGGYGGGRHRSDNNRRGYGSGQYNDGYGAGSGYDQQQYSGQYQAGADAGGYDYSQYQQYYAQYYANQNGETANQGYQYGGYPYSYGQYDGSGAADAGKKQEATAEAGDVSEKEGTKEATEIAPQSKEAAAAVNDEADKDVSSSGQDAAYYAQYYGGTGDQAQQQQQWTQEAYYRWYQQYYGNQYAGAENQQQSSSTTANDQQQQQQQQPQQQSPQEHPAAQTARSEDTNKEPSDQ